MTSLHKGHSQLPDYQNEALVMFIEIQQVYASSWKSRRGSRCTQHGVEFRRYITGLNFTRILNCILRIRHRFNDFGKGQISVTGLTANLHVDRIGEICFCRDALLEHNGQDVVKLSSSSSRGRDRNLRT